jgi:hypothetical protein
MNVIQPDMHSVLIELTFLEAIGLYMLCLGIDNPDTNPDRRPGDLPIGEAETVRSALQIRLREIVET